MDAAAELGRNPVSKHQIQPAHLHTQAESGTADCKNSFTVSFCNIFKSLCKSPN